MDTEESFFGGGLGPSEGRLDASKRERAASLLARHGAQAAFVRVECLSKILGVSAAAIYARMRSGTFFMPHRRLGNIPVVKTEDLIDWYCATEAEAASPQPRALISNAGNKPASPAPLVEESEQSKRLRDKEESRKIVAIAMARMAAGSRRHAAR